MTNQRTRLGRLAARLAPGADPVLRPDPVLVDVLRLCAARAGHASPALAGMEAIEGQRAELRELVADRGWERGLAAWLADPGPALTTEMAAQAGRWEARAA